MRMSVVALVLTAMGAMPVVAAAEEQPAEHCVSFVTHQKPDGELELTKPDCFDSEQAAEHWASVGMSQRLQNLGIFDAGVGGLSSFTLGRHFDGFNGSGSSISIVGSSCTGGYWNATATWDNRISSSYNGCARLTHWDYPAKSGQSQSTYGAGTTDNLSTLNNKASSVSYHSG